MNHLIYLPHQGVVTPKPNRKKYTSLNNEPNFYNMLTWIQAKSYWRKFLNVLFYLFLYTEVTYKRVCPSSSSSMAYLHQCAILVAQLLWELWSPWLFRCVIKQDSWEMKNVSCLGSNVSSATSQLCDFKQVILSPCASV